MGEHEMLKEICKKIGYEPLIGYGDTKIGKRYISFKLGDDVVYANVREIIFTQEFMNKFTIKYVNSSTKYELFKVNILLTLDNPVLYLYNLIKDD